MLNIFKHVVDVELGNKVRGNCKSVERPKKNSKIMEKFITSIIKVDEVYH